MPKMQNIPKNNQMNFNAQPYMFFGKIIFCKCDMHLKLNILNPVNISFLSKGFKNESFAFEHFSSKFKNFEIFVWIVFY